MRRSKPSLADLGDIACCIVLAISSVVVILEFAGIASFAWRCLGVVLSPLR